MRTGILGGTFDPIHVAHLHAGECALFQAGLDRVLFMPAGDPWQKTGRRITAARHRFEMTRIAVAGVDGFAADDREVARDGPTFTVDTLATFPDDEELFLILGADAALGLPTWHRIDEILERVTVLVAPRPGTDSTLVLDVVPDVVFLDMAVLGISATEIRRMSAASQPYRFLVTSEVHDYIEENALYTDASKGDIVGSSMEESS